MLQIGIHETKTRLSEIVKRVQKGEEFVITNRGEEVAILSPADKHSKKKNYDIIKKLRKLAKESPPGDYEELISWKNEGRK